MIGRTLSVLRVRGQRLRPWQCLVEKTFRQDKDQTVSSRIIQLGMHDHNDERKQCIACEGQS
jgi:hypothetical protein